MDKITGQNGWNEWSKHVLIELERLNSEQKRHNELINNLSKDLEIFKTKIETRAAIKGATFGIIASAIISVGSALIFYFK